MKRGWEIKILQDICWTISDIDHNMPKAVDIGIPFISAKDITDDNRIDFLKTKYIGKSDFERLSRKIIPQKGDIIYTRIGTIGKAAIVTDEIQFLPSYSCCTVRPRNEYVDTKFLLYFLISEVALNQAKFGINGAGVPDLGMRVIKNFKISIPPLPEQKRIVEILTEAFAAIARAKANAEQNLKNAKELFESYLSGIFENPNNIWKKKKLGDVCDFVRGPFGGSLKKSIFKQDGYAVYEQQHAIYNQFDNIRYFIDEDKFNEMKRFELNSGDLIMSCSGTMGKIAIVPDNIKKGIINQALLKLSPSEKISNAFLKLWMQSESFQNSLKDNSGGAAIQNVASVAILKNIEVPLPVISEQIKIVQEVQTFANKISKLENIYKKRIEDLDELKKSILEKAFNGELTSIKESVI